MRNWLISILRRAMVRMLRIEMRQWAKRHDDLFVRFRTSAAEQAFMAERYLRACRHSRTVSYRVVEGAFGSKILGVTFMEKPDEFHVLMVF